MESFAKTSCEVCRWEDCKVFPSKAYTLRGNCGMHCKFIYSFSWVVEMQGFFLHQISLVKANL
jgi:hypothetical protein